jgi:glyoxylase-like metal-dependent hydrolase (beta-lactamase superfamily II)
VLWHAKLGSPPRYGTARCAAAIRDELSGPHGKDSIAEWIPPEIAEQIAWDVFGLITALPAGTARIPWAGPQVRIIEHPAHAAGHAALLIEERGVLVAGDMLSDA